MADNDTPDVSEEHPESERWVWTGKHRPPVPRALIEQMTKNWADATPSTQRHPAVERSAARRHQLSAAFPGKTLVIPTGQPKVRSDDTDYRFRPGTDFYWLTGGSEPESVLVLHPEGDGHRATVYVRPPRDHTSHHFFTSPNGEVWVGPQRGPAALSSFLGVETASLDDLKLDELDGANTLAVRGIDPIVDQLVTSNTEDEQLRSTLNEFRLVKDDFEVAQLEKAVAATVRGFEDVVRAIPEAIERGERVIEGVFNLRARVEGNDVGYNTIAASGSHASILHWTRNDGEVRPGDLLLLDAGVEGNELYTADVTRTLPISGKFNKQQREIYDLVWAAQKAALSTVRPGANFRDPHDAAMKILAEGLHLLGILKVDPQMALRRDQQTYRRWTLHGTSHMLGLDVHDCSHARDEHYAGGKLQPGFVLTVEPGLYFQPDDLGVPEEYRGIGVRIEDDVLVTETGHRVLSSALPTDPEEIERWMRDLGLNDPGATPGLLG